MNFPTWSMTMVPGSRFSISSRAGNSRPSNCTMACQPRRWMRAVSGATISHFRKPPAKKKNRRPRMPAACSRSSSASVTLSSATAMPREVRAHHLHRRDGAAIVLAVGGGLHHDGVRDAQILAHLQVFGSRRVVRLGDRSRRDRIARLVDVHMHVPSAGGRFQTRGGLVFRGAHGACVTTGSRGDNLNLAAWNEIINALRRARRGGARRPRRRGLRASPGSSAPHRPAAARRTCGRGPRAHG